MELENVSTADDERAVSPVIGVILMVAITVILAAVIGAFVLGIGGDQEEAPQATLNLDCSDEELFHRGGETLNLNNPEEVVIGSDGDIDWDGGSPTGDELSAGGSEALDISGDERLVLVHNPSESVILDRSC